MSEVIYSYTSLRRGVEDINGIVRNINDEIEVLVAQAKIAMTSWTLHDAERYLNDAQQIQQLIDGLNGTLDQLGQAVGESARQLTEVDCKLAASSG